MNNEIKKRLAKLRELAERGATEGEKKAARKGMERIIEKYNLKDVEFIESGKLTYSFKYQTQLEVWLLMILSTNLVEVDHTDKFKRTHSYESGYQNVKEIVMNLEYLDFITIECAYEYFRVHMKKEWNRICLPVINRCRKKSTKRKRREDLQWPFFSEYGIKSGLFKKENLTKKPLDTKADQKRAELLSDVEGGKFHSQVSNGLYLSE